MEFVPTDEVMNLLRSNGIREVSGDGGCTYMEMEESEGVVHMHLADDTSEVAPREGAGVIPVPREKLAELVDDIIHKLRLNQVLLVPVGRWANILDAVAFSLAENEDWHEFDAEATIERNTRRPLLCEPADYQTLAGLMAALVENADQPEQGLILLTTSTPVLLEYVPEAAVRLTLGQQVLADEIAEIFEA